MWRLYHHHLCPFSRRVRIALAEKRIEFDLVLEKPWERRDDFLMVSPAGQTPVLHDEKAGLCLSDSGSIIEYLEETTFDHPLIEGLSLIHI